MTNLFAQQNDGIKYTVTVLDSASQSPINKASVILKKNETVIENGTTDAKGQAFFNIEQAGEYTAVIRLQGYRELSKIISITSDNNTSNFSIAPSEYITEEIDIIGERKKTSQSEITPITGLQVYNADVTHSAPTARMTNIIHDNLTGAVPAPTGEVHIRGMHGEFSYIIDGIPVSLGVFGGLNEVVDPKVVNKIKFITGGFSSEFGGQLAAVLEVENRIPSGNFHFDFSNYAGSYLVFNGTSPFHKGIDVPSGHSSNAPGDTLGGSVGPFRTINSNGQSLSFSGHFNKIGYFLFGFRQQTDRRIDPPVATLFNDKGTDYFLYGKLDYSLTKNDYLTLNLNYGTTQTQVPFDINSQGYAPDKETAGNSFQTLSYTHIFPSGKDKQQKLFVGLIGRQGSLQYLPSSISPVTFSFAGDSTLYALNQDRGFSSFGINSKYDISFSRYFSGFAGINFTATNGKADFTSRDSLGNAGPSEFDKYSGSDFGIFAGIHWLPVKYIGLDLGLRYDQHIAPDAGLSKQISPRIKLSFLIDKNNSGYIYFGRLFMPTNVEGLKALASNVTQGGTATLPERDDFFEAVFTHKFNFGLIAKTAAYYKYSSPGLDDESIGSSAVKTPVNIAIVKTTGIELSFSYEHPKIPIGVFINTALIHAYGIGAVTGGFLQILDDGTGTDLDHDQRLTITSGLNYHPKNWFAELNANYGSGLTNGNPNAVPYKTGLLDFNQYAHVKQRVLFNMGAGYTFEFKNGISIQPSIYINNVLDDNYLLKGAFFSGASYGERRNVVLKLSLHI